MTNARAHAATVGVTESGSAAVLVTVRHDGALVDRRRVQLTPPALPSHPHHHEGSWAIGRYANTPGARRITLPDAVALVERVARAAAEGARIVLEALAADVPVPVVGIAVRACPSLPHGIEARIRDHRAQAMADSVMYREALAAAAIALGWQVSWYDRDDVARQAALALDGRHVGAALDEMGREAGPPWQAAHKLAATAAFAAMPHARGVLTSPDAHR